MVIDGERADARGEEGGPDGRCVIFGGCKGGGTRLTAAERASEASRSTGGEVVLGDRFRLIERIPGSPKREDGCGEAVDISISRKQRSKCR